MFTTRSEEALLDRLVTQTRNSVRDYREASRDRSMLAHREMLIRRAEERETIVGMLSDRIRDLGLEPPQTGSITGAVIRSWAFFRSATSSTQDVLLDSIADGERALRRDFQDALLQEMHPITRRVISEAAAIMANGIPMTVLQEALEAA